jgi:predicted DNA-binding transcriptional regulator AlpA
MRAVIENEGAGLAHCAQSAYVRDQSIPTVHGEPHKRNYNGRDGLIDIREVARRLGGCNRRTVYRLVARGELVPPIKVGGRAQWFVADINAYFTKLKQNRLRNWHKSEPAGGAQ